MTVKNARSQMPRVGDTLMEIPTIVLWQGVNDFPEPEPCTVIWTNPAHLFYVVQFENGIRECYKLPRPKRSPRGGLLL